MAVPDGLSACPHCHTLTDATQKIALRDFTWCPTCGALAPSDADLCPKCGSRLREDPPARPVRNLDLPEIDRPDEVDESAGTGVMTRIESAIPPTDDESSPSARRDRMPRPRAFAFAAIFAVAIVGGATLLITHPWDPTASQTKARQPADTSMSGFPGLVDSLTGQDVERGGSGEGEGSTLSVDDLLAQTHSELGELSRDVDASEEALRDACEESGTAVEGLDSAQAISIEVSNTIATLDGVYDTDEARTESIEHLKTLGSWLRNRCDALTKAWSIYEGADDPSTVSDQVIAQLDSSSDYRGLFEENYETWAPDSTS